MTHAIHSWSRNDATRERLAGAVWGHLIGDAMGVPYEFRDPEQIGSVCFGETGTHGQPPGTWSDDGALMLALLDSLLRDRRPSEPAFDTIDQARRFLAWLDGGEYTPDGDGLFDIGRTTSEALARLHVGAPAELAGGTDEGDSGNGSLMRILPLALVERDISAAELVDHAHRSSAITHGNELAQATCALYVLSARCLLGGAGPAEALRLARLQLRTTYERGRESHARLAALGKLEAWTARSGSGYVVDSFWSGWDAFAAAASFQQTVENAIKYGHDTDTTACVAGGLAGIWYGRSGIPEGWLRSIRGADTVGRLVARLLGTVD